MKRVDERGIEYLGADDTRPYLLACNSGWIRGSKTFRVFGTNPNVDTSTDPEFVWDGQTEYIYPDSNEIIYLLSSSASDAGVEVKISGLVIENGLWVEKTNRVFLNSTFISAGNFVRIFEIKVLNSTSVTGVIQARTDTSYQEVPNGNETLRAQISRGLDNSRSRNASLMSMYTVPDNKTAFLFKIFSGVRKNQDAEFDFQYRPFNGSFSSLGITTEISGGNQYEIGYEVFKSKSDFRVMVTTDTNNAQASSSFHFLVVDNNKLSKEFLNEQT